MSKISELSDGGSLLPTDFLIAVRSGGNVKVQADQTEFDRIRLGDNEKIELGNSQDISIYWDGSVGKITNSVDITGTATMDGLTVNGAAEGDTYFTGGTASSRLLNVFTSTHDGGANAGHNFKIASGQGAFIFGNNTTANLLTVQSGGIDVTGTATVDGLVVGGSATGTITLGEAGYNGTIQAPHTLTLDAQGAGESVVIKTQSTERMRISSGTLFQGTTSPTLHSSVTGTVFTNGSLITESTRGANNSLTLAQNLAVDAGNTWAYLSTDEASYYQQYNGNHYFGTAPSGSAGSDASVTSKLTILNSGNVGIGIAPTNKLNVDFSITGEGSQEGGIKIQNSHGSNNDIAPVYFGVHGGDRRTKAAIGLKREGAYGIGSLIFALDANGDDANVSFATDEVMRIDNQGRFALGTSSTTLYGKAAIQGGKAGAADSNLSLLTDGAAQGEVANLAFYGTFVGTSDNGPRRTADITAGFDAANWGSEYLSFNVGNAGASNDTRSLTNEAMRLSGGNLLVGTTDSAPYDNSADSTADNGIAAGAGLFAAARYQGSVGLFNRTGNDGEIIGFKRSGAHVGSIGTLGDDMLVGTGNTGLRFYDAGKAIQPRNTDGSTARGSDAISLGMSDDPFADLYLTGGVVFGATGGVVTSKTLDDYEEGTWTPTVTGLSSVTYTNALASYTKIGRFVEIQLYLTFSGTATGSQFQIDGLPFTSAGATTAYGGCFINYQNGVITNGEHNLHIGAGSTTISFYATSGSAIDGTNLDRTSGCSLIINGIYAAA